MSLEADVEEKAVEYADALDYYILKLNGGGNRGKPDRLFVNLAGEHIYIEFKRPSEELRKDHKRPSEELRKDQWLHVRDLTRRSCLVYQCSDVRHAQRILDNHRNTGAEAIDGRLTYQQAVMELSKGKVEL